MDASLKPNPGLASRSFNRNALIVLALGFPTAVGLVLASAAGTKWLVFIFMSLICMAGLLMISDRERFLLYITVFVLPIGLNFHLIYLKPMVYRPVRGVVFEIFDVPFFFLMILWLLRVFTTNRRVRLYPEISIPFALIWLLTMVGLYGSTNPPIISAWSLVLLLKNLLVFLFVANNVRDRRTIMIVIGVLLATAVVQALLGYAQRFTGGRLGLEILGESTQSFRMMKAGATVISRVAGTFGSPNRLAAYLGLLLPINFALFFAPLEAKYKRYLVVSLALVGLAEILTFSRGGWVGLAVGGALTLYWCTAKRITDRFWSFVFVGFIVVSFIVLAIILVEPLRTRLFEDDYGAAYTRIPLALVALNLIRHNPFFGVGLGNYTAPSFNYDNTPEGITQWFPWPVHNEFLLIAGEQGLPALALFLFIFIILMVKIVRVGKNVTDPVLAHAAVGLTGGLVAWVIHHQFESVHVFVTPLYWFLFGLIQAMFDVVREEAHLEAEP